MMEREYCALICSVLTLIATVLSWITMATGNWKYYIPTILFALTSLGLAIFALFFI